MLEIINISKSYGNQEKAVDALTLNLEQGKIYGLLGPNGAGKTTTLKMITGILHPDTGDVTINNHSINNDPLEAKRQFAFVQDEPNAFLRLTGQEYLNFIADIYGIDADTRQARIKELADKFEMTDVLSDRISTYSHGMRQKIFLVAALVQNPPVWILDEPMTGLDPRSAFILKDMMAHHTKQGNLVLFSTHVLDVAEKVCDEIIIIQKGKIVAQGTIEELRAKFAKDSSLESIFLELTDAQEYSTMKEGE